MGLGDWLRELRDFGLENVAGRYYSKYIGVVEDSADPQGQGRVRVSCPTATGRAGPLAAWAYPSADHAGQDKGTFFPPDVGDMVWVWFEMGDPSAPRYSGGWWGNRNQDKTPSGSHVPAEFRPAQGEAPTRRGIKTKGGHGLLFDDTTDENKVELWTGTPGSAGAAATRRHQVQLDNTDGAEQIVVLTEGGHSTKWIDIAGQEAVTTKTKKGHEFTLSDKDDKILAKTLAGYKLEIDEKTKKITLLTPVGQKLEMLDTPPTINVQDATGNMVTLAPSGVTVTAPGLVNVTAGGAVNVTAGATATVTATGALALAGSAIGMATAGPVTTSGAGAVSSFAGASVASYVGGLAETVVGAWAMTALTALVAGALPSSVLLGSLAGVKYRLVDERFLIWAATHTHPTTAPGAPTGVPDQTIVAESYATLFTRAD